MKPQWDYRKLSAGITSAFGLWVATQPTLFPSHPFMRQLAIFIAAGGLILVLGIPKRK